MNLKRREFLKLGAMSAALLATLIVATLFVALFTGCSKHSSTAAAPNITDLGVVEVADGIPIHRNLGNGRAWVITPTIVQGTNVRLAITLLVTNSTGSVQELACPVIMSPAGHSMGVGDGGRFPGIRITPQIKP